MVGTQIELMPHERMVLHAHPHWWYFWKQVAGGVVLLAVFMLRYLVDDTLATVLGWVVAVAAVIWLADTIYEFVQWQTTRFAVTTERVAYQNGIIRRRGVSIPLNRINNVNFDQSLIARLLNNGIVTIESAGETGDSVFENIRDPEHVRGVIFQQIEADEQADSERDAAAFAQVMQQEAPSPASSTLSAEERLNQLNELRNAGLVSEEEFARKRAEILNDL
ncbi:MAG TPA: PH domain-containing protein [Euzebyales bacterium]|nr:PH domain-containing protein [Euzebyales bacterium]